MTKPQVDLGDPAFPVPAVMGDYGHSRVDGMTMRQWYAGQALSGVIAAILKTNSPNDIARVDAIVAAAAFKIADAMIAQQYYQVMG